MKYNQAGIAFMPKAPKTAEATAITILGACPTSLILLP